MSIHPRKKRRMRFSNYNVSCFKPGCHFIVPAKCQTYPRPTALEVVIQPGPLDDGYGVRASAVHHQ